VLALKCRLILSKEGRDDLIEDEWGSGLVSRAIRNQNFWLAVGYVGLILLMARAYA